MKQILFNRDWYLTKGMAYSTAFAPEKEKIQLPYDAMIHEKRCEQTKSGSQTGFYPGGIYTYMKSFFVPEEWKEKRNAFFFEGVYGEARVFINGNFAGSCPNGYAGFVIEANKWLEYGIENELAVLVCNEEQSSRWYNGCGIYRDVWLLQGGFLHIPEFGVKVSTPEIDPDIAVIFVETKIRQQGNRKQTVKVVTELVDQNGCLCGRSEKTVTCFPDEMQEVKQRIAIENPLLWSTENPNLYRCLVRVMEDGTQIDEMETTFGIRQLKLDRKYGLRINGETIKLRGACIHHDNGVLGSAAFKDAEERKIRLLKEAGFNCIRSSHNPCSRYLLDACDRYGMLVMDELSDMWNMPKNPYDYARFFHQRWKEDVADLVNKDFNHPSVILYSLGNELVEAGRPQGAEINRKLVHHLRLLDATRYITNAGNGIPASMYTCLNKIVEKVKEEHPELADTGIVEKQDGSDEGSNFINMILSAQAGPLGDAVACSNEMDEVLDEFQDSMDIAGYNYMTGRHKREGEKYPNRLLLATETYPGDVFKVWQSVAESVHVLGEMTWTGYDYLGEAGCGIFYYDGTANFSRHWPDSLAYIGDIDITGYRRPISYYREVVYGLRKEPYIAVERLNRYGQTHSKSQWLFTDTIESWTWNGYEGKPARIEVYTNAEEVELFLNGRSLGRQRMCKEQECIASFEAVYEPGELLAVAYENGKEVGRNSLKTAEDAVSFSVWADRDTMKADGTELCYVEIEFADRFGTKNRSIEKEVELLVEGEGVIEGVGSANPQTESHYQDFRWKSYDGRLLCVLRGNGNAGKIKLKLMAEEIQTEELVIQTG